MKWICSDTSYNTTVLYSSINSTSIAHVLENRMRRLCRHGLGYPDERWQSLPSLARAMGRDANYLGLLARQGKLEARKHGGRWYNTEAAVRRYTEQAQEGLSQRDG